jgi:2-amino-4-hydroxy-6-hydroxymethyldihydropteridine diphosphokinase
VTLGYLGLGSNVGDRRANLERAVAALPGHGVEVRASSSVYETEPVGLVVDQRAFYNACLRVCTTFDPEPLLDVCKAVERGLGRREGGLRHGPRPIDVDLLLLDELEHESERLTLPHPEVLSWCRCWSSIRSSASRAASAWPRLWAGLRARRSRGSARR